MSFEHQSRASLMVTRLLPWCMPFLVEEYVRENGAVPYQDWFDSLDAAAAAKVAVAKKRQEADIARAWALHAEYKARKAQAAQREKKARKKR